MAYYVELARVPLNAHEKPDPPQFIRLSCKLAKEFASASKRDGKCLGRLVEKLSHAAERSEHELFKTIRGEYHGSHSALISDDQWLGTTIKPTVDQKPKNFFSKALKSHKVDVGKMVEVRSNVYPCVAYYEWTKVPATVKRRKVNGAVRSRFRVYFPFEDALKLELARISLMLKHWAGKAVAHISAPAHDEDICALANQIKAKFPSIASNASRRRNGELVVEKPAVQGVVRKFVYIGVNDLGPRGKTFGKGVDGRVFQTSWLGGTFARKEFDLEDTFVRESDIAARVSHPHVVHIFGSPLGNVKPAIEDVKPIAATWDVKPAIEDVNRIAAAGGVKPFLLMEILDEDLYHFLRFNKVHKKHNRTYQDEAATWKPPLPVSDALEVLIQVAKGMEHLHERNVVHGDLKSGNILISAFELQKPHVWLYLVKVADLGQAQDLDRWPTEPFVPGPGTTWYVAPEVLEFRDGITNEILNPKKIDVYSFGIVAYEVLTGHSPYPDDIYFVALKKKVLAGHRPNIDKLKARKLEKFQCPDALVNLVVSCWDEAPDKRPTFAEICKKIIDIKDMKAQTSAAVKPANGASPKVMSEQYPSKLESKLRNLWHPNRNLHHHQFN